MMSASRSLFMVVSATVLLSLVVAWPYGGNDDYSSWRKSRRSFQCTGSGGKCFSTSHCCHGFVCAAVDDFFGEETRTKKGERPEIPGFCVKEKDLQPCDLYMGCAPTSTCVALGRSGERYCVPRPMERPDIMADEQSITIPRGHKGYQSDQGSHGSGGQSSPCEDSGDCKAYSEEGEQLCCQRVKRGRQGVKIMCDVKTAISSCL